MFTSFRHIFSSERLPLHIKPVAQAGLVAIGILYSLLGTLTFMAAFHLNGESSRKADRSGVFDFIHEQTGGHILLLIMALGLMCYSVWRWVQTFGDTEHRGKDLKGILNRFGYLCSGIAYTFLTWQIFALVLHTNHHSGDANETLAQELLDKPFGQWLVGLAAAILLGVGIAQMYLGVSGKFRKNVAEHLGKSRNEQLLLSAGRIGYTARGIVWVIISWLFLKAAMYTRPREAGGTSKAFRFLEDWPYGSYLLALVGLGFICYGLFNFIRVRYEDFE